MIRALLVDDEEPARDRLRGLLAGLDDVRIVGEARDGEEALEKIARHRPDLVFVDIEMPGRTGLQLASALPPPRPQIIFCTAYEQYAVQAFRHEASDYLLKPVSRKNLSRAVDRVRQALEETVYLHRELADASSTQERLFPRAVSGMAGLDCAGVCRPARNVAGDYYDFIPVDRDRLGIAVGDVSGKGLFAGLLMAGLQARVQSLAPVHDRAVDLLAGELDRQLGAILAPNRYATLFYGLYEGSTRSLTYMNAGHLPALLLRPGAPTHRLDATGPVVGLLPEATYRREQVTLESGDVLLSFTDGLTEACNEDGEEFGTDRMERLVRARPGRGAGELVEAILGDVREFSGGTEPHDDVTLVVACVR